MRFHILSYRPVARQRLRDNSRCYAAARETHLYNNRVTAGKGVILKTTGATQLVVSCELSSAREAVKI
jgi:hypothetical protein